MSQANSTIARDENRGKGGTPSGGRVATSGGGGGGVFKQYKPEQGKWTRLGTFCGLMLIILWGCYFLFDKLQIYEGAEAWRMLVTRGIPAAVAVILGFVAWWVSYSNRKASDFMIATEGEMKKVSWSTRPRDHRIDQGRDHVHDPVGGSPVRGRLRAFDSVHVDRRVEGMTEGDATTPDTPQPSTATAAGMKWYVLRVASNKEGQVRAALERKVKIEGLEERVGRILVPTVPEKKMKAGVLRVMQRKLYPGYVFVEMACEEDGSVNESVWFVVKETTGVGDFIGSDGKPTSMPEHEVAQMLMATEKAEEEPTLSGLNIHKGDQVKVTDGAFESYEGEVESVDERRGMVSVIVSIFGRMTPVEVGYWQIEKVE